MLEPEKIILDQIAIFDQVHKFGSTVQEKYDELQVSIEEADIDKLKQAFPHRSPLQENAYVKVATEPNGKEYVGYIEVDGDNDNYITAVEVLEDYQRRGVASQLIRKAQADFDHLRLANNAGPVGKALYEKLGFKQIDQFDNFVWIIDKES